MDIYDEPHGGMYSAACHVGILHLTSAVMLQNLQQGAPKRVEPYAKLSVTIVLPFHEIND